MQLDTILSLRSEPGAPAAAIQNALSRAITARVVADKAVTEAEGVQRNVLGADDRALSQAERDGDKARLMRDRLDGMIPLLRVDLAEAVGRETLATLRADHADLMKICERLTTWQTATNPKIAEMVAEGFQAQAEAEQAISGFKARVIQAHACKEMREAGPLNVTMPEIAYPVPRHIFPNWK